MGQFRGVLLYFYSLNFSTCCSFAFMGSGDILFACTDGVLDSKSLRGEAFGKDRLQKTIIENTGLSAQSMISTTYNSLLEFLSKELDDDVSIFTLKMLK